MYTIGILVLHSAHTEHQIQERLFRRRRPSVAIRIPGGAQTANDPCDCLLIRLVVAGLVGS